jgi:hypothetical protein
MNERTARVILIGADSRLQAAFEPHCMPGDIAVAAAPAAALDLLHGRGVYAGQTALRPRLLVLAAFAADAAAVDTLKADARARTIPLVVLCEAGAVAACYHAGANACVVWPGGEWPAAVGAIAGFWLGANEIEPGD